MNVLGINFVFHDSTACLVQDGRLTIALEEERFTRRKHTGQFPRQTISRCLEESGLAARDIDHVAVSFKPSLHWGRRVSYGLRHGSMTGLGFLAFRSRIRDLMQWLDSAYPDRQKPRLQ